MHRIRVVRVPSRAAAHPVRVVRAHRRHGSVRRWRRHSRRAQVSAVATIFGLMIVVTFLANYIATTLPNQMAVNDLNHEIQVEDQLGSFRALLQAVSGTGIVGAPALQPVALGSAAAPPFASADSGSILPIPGEPQAQSNFSIVSTRYAPPTGWPAGGSYDPTCSQSPASPANATTISCKGAGKSHVTYNFTGSSSYSVSGTGGVAFFVNYSTNHSLIVVSATGMGGGFENVEIVGSSDTAFINATGGMVQNVVVVGKWDNVTLSVASGVTANVLIVGNHDTITVSDVPGSSSSVLVNAWGSYDLFNAGYGVMTAYFTGFNHENPTSPICPYDNLAATDNVTAPSHPKGTYTVTYNNTAHRGTTTQFTPWTTIYNIPTPGACIFFPQITGGGLSGYAATLLVQLHNRYAPAAEVAFDQGAVVYVQPGGYPYFVQSPPVAFANGAAKVWVPVFLQSVGAEGGAGTAGITAHLVAVETLSFPSNGWVVNTAKPLTLVYQSPYASAWYNYFVHSPAFAGDVTCAPSGSVACVGPYEPGGAIGTVTLTLPATSISLQFAVFSVALA